MAPERLTPAHRAQVVEFANRHGPTQAARRFRVPVGSVKTWQARARVRAARAQAWREAAATARPEPEVADPAPDEAELARRMAAGLCLRCGGQGTVAIPEVRRGSLVLRRARRLRCPNCGGRPRHVQVVEHPPASWTAAQRLAGDLGLGWNEREWGMIRAGEVDPDGFRFTGRDTPGGGQ